LQVAVGVGLILITQYNIKKEAQLDRANRINNFTMIGIFLITIINVFVSAFSISIDMADSVPASPVRLTDASDAQGAITEPSI
jgi:Ninjurin